MGSLSALRTKTDEVDIYSELATRVLASQGIGQRAAPHSLAYRALFRSEVSCHVILVKV